MNLTLLTDRLCLTTLVDVDIDLAVEMFTDPEVVRYVCDLMSKVEIKTEMSNWTKRGGNGCIGIWCISDLKTNERFGSIFLLPMPVDEEDTNYSLVVPGEMPEAEIEIGFALKRTAWGKGYATEACSRILRFAFEETILDEVIATFYEENLASKRVLEKVGLIDRGRMWCYGEDSPNYRVTRAEWRKFQSSR